MIFGVRKREEGERGNEEDWFLMRKTRRRPRPSYMVCSPLDGRAREEAKRKEVGLPTPFLTPRNVGRGHHFISAVTAGTH